MIYNFLYNQLNVKQMVFFLLNKLLIWFIIFSAPLQERASAEEKHINALYIPQITNPDETLRQL